MTKRFFGLVILGFFALAAYSQAVSVPYVMSFEEDSVDSAELANWHLNPGTAAANCNDEWMVGSAVKSDGKRSLYVHIKDSTDNPTFWNHPNLQFAYRDFVLPAGTFNISFDWLNAGPQNAAMYVGYVAFKNNPSSTANQVTANSTSGSMPSALTSANNSGALFGQSTWQSYTFPAPLTSKAGTTYRFYVAWANSCLVDTAVLSGCIDNIQITDARCQAPTNIQAELIGCDTVILTWSGAADSYEVAYRKQGQNSWSAGYSDPANPTLALLEGLTEGSYDFRVRGICHDDQGNEMKSSWANYEEEFLIYCKELHCITYFDLHDSATTCYFGRGYNGYQSSKNVAYQNQGVVDYGYESEMSRHTVCWDKTAKDPNTNGLLNIVPQGAIAAVRLGNWQVNAEAEAVSYKYTVDSALSILLLRYAIVLEDPDHEVDAQPRFVLEILDQNDDLIDPTCGHINFAAHAGAAGWQTVGAGYSQVTFKDWSTIGLNLENYVGQQITIRLTTYDCSYSGHYGYAYFTLDCAGATLQTTSCGDNTSLTAEAPDGFNYLWTDENGTTLGTSKTLNVVTSDTIEYTCRLTNKEEPTCWFELSVKALPQFPVADFTYKYDPQDCKNRVVFTNKSYIETRYNGNVEKHYDELAGYSWSFGDGEMSSQKNNVHIYPQAGGTFTVSLTGWIAEGEGACRQDTTLTIKIPAIGDANLLIDTTLCEGEYLEFEGERLTEPEVKQYVHSSRAGCDSIITLDLKFNRSYNITLPNDTAICEDEDLCINGDCFDKQGSVFTRRLRTIKGGCDSIVSINVRLLPRFDVDMNRYPVLCANEDSWYIPMDILSGDVASLDWISGPEALATGVFEPNYTFAGTWLENYTQNTTVLEVPLKDDPAKILRAGRYMFTMVPHLQEGNCADEVEVILEVRYPISIMIMRESVIYILNKESNGGYDFSNCTFQWYHNGEMMDGYTKDQVDLNYLPEEGKRGYYECLITDTISNISLFTCKFYVSDPSLDPVGWQDVESNLQIGSTCVEPGEEILLNQSGEIRLYDSLGRLLAYYNMTGVSAPVVLQAPSISGVYLLNVNDNTVRFIVK